MKTIFQFREGSRLTGDAQAVGEELERLKAAHGGITAHLVVKKAAAPNSALHSYFEWNDTRAAEAHRLSQAGHLIRCVAVVIEPEPASEAPAAVSVAQGLEPSHTPLRVPQMRAFVPVSTPKGDRVYLSTTEALGDSEYRRQVLAQAHHDLGVVARKYRELKELAEVVAAIDRVGEMLTDAQPTV